MFQLRPLHAEIDRLRDGTFQLRVGLHHVGFRGNADVVAIFGELKRFFIGDDGVIEHLFLCVTHAQLQIAGDEFGLQRQTHRFEIGCTGRSRCVTRFQLAPHAAPDIDFPIGPDVRAMAGADFRRYATARRGAAAARIRARRNRREQSRARRLCKCRSLPIFRFGNFQTLIGHFDLLDECIQFGIAK